MAEGQLLALLGPKVLVCFSAEELTFSEQAEREKLTLTRPSNCLNRLLVLTSKMKAPT
jgi:hypothetical protein